MVESGWWQSTMEYYFGPIEQYGNFTRGKQGGAQFCVSRDRIRTLPREFYRRMYDWLVKNTIDEINVGIDPITLCRNPMISDGHPLSNMYTSRYLEWTWELIFTSYKKSDPLGLNLSDNKISSLYGANGYYRDVTLIVVRNFLHSDSIFIPINVNFNTFFSDPIYGSLKQLIITINENKFIFDETRNKDINIPLINSK
jgi:hypothetical protein